MSLFDLQKKIYAAINVYAVTSKAKIYDYVPEAKKLPFIVIGDDSTIELKTKTFMGYETTSILHIWGQERSMKTVKTLLETITNLLSNDLGNFSFHGITSMSIRRESVEYVKGTLEVKFRFTEV
jgi:hypothetical protein